MSAKAELLDRHGRKIDYIRLSLTDRCNFRCVYCMPPQGEEHIPHKEILSYEELLKFCRVAASLGIGRYKITGGEPLCRKGAVDFIRTLKQISGVEQVTLTTNGALLGKHLPELAAIGIDGINISLDTLSAEHYAGITRSRVDIREILAAVLEAKRLGLRVKINTVPLAAHNGRDLPELTRFALENGCHIRFIELMPVGPGRIYEGVPQEQVRRMVEETFGPLDPLTKRLGNGPAEYYSIAGYDGGVGFISAVSKKFCASCNRIRLTSLGYLKTCLHHNIGVDIKPLLRGAASNDELAAALIAAVEKKPLAHEFSSRPDENESTSFLMNSVGG